MPRWSRALVRVLPLVLPLALLALAPLAPRSLAAQQFGPAPKRPRLAATADTNDAHAYLDFGNAMAVNAPDDAASAFYWAARIDPGLADAHYGRRIALLLRNEGLLKAFMSNRKPTKEEQALDSLQLRAVMLNPFLYRRLDPSLVRTYYRQAIEHDMRLDGGSPDAVRGELEFHLDSWLRQAGPYMRGWMAYGRGNFPYALSEYATAMKQEKEKAGLRIERGRIFGMRGEADSALAEFQLALVELRKRDAKDVVVLYNSKAVVEQAIGILLEQKDDLAGAREAYGRALQEDLSYWPAHVRLGLAAISAGDTAAAVSELTLASQIAANEPYVHAVVGASLAALARQAEGLEELKKAIALEPYYALPYVAAARIYDASSFTDEAMAAYRDFLARASRTDPQRPLAEQRLAALKAAGQ